VVDVIATFPGGDDGGEGGTRVVAAGVPVLAVDGTRTSDGAPALGVTVLVTPHEARDLAFAQSRGELTLALVPPEEAAAP